MGGRVQDSVVKTNISLYKSGHLSLHLILTVDLCKCKRSHMRNRKTIMATEAGWSGAGSGDDHKANS